MITTLLILWLCVAILIIFLLSIRPQRTTHSLSELKRKQQHALILREKHLSDIDAYRRIFVGLLLIGLLFLSMSLWDGVGIVVTIIFWLVGGWFAGLKVIHSGSMKLYKKLEPRALRLSYRMPILGKLFGAYSWRAHEQKLESSEHLVHLLDTDSHALSSEQKTIIKNGLHWHLTLVESIMVPTKKIVSVKSNELLGPLVLDDLHKTGHSRFPVTNGSIDDIVGILDISGLLEVSVASSSETADKIMSSNVLRIEVDQTLPQALELLKKSHQHMLIVVDEYGHTVGLLTLADITKSLLGE